MVGVIRPLRYSIDQLEQTEGTPDQQGYLVAKCIIKGSHQLDTQPTKWVRTARKRAEITFIQQTLEEGVEIALRDCVEDACIYILPATESRELFSMDDAVAKNGYRGIILDILYRKLRDRKPDYRRDRLTSFGNAVIGLFSGKGPIFAGTDEDPELLDYESIPEHLLGVYQQLHNEYRAIRGAAKRM